MRLRNSPRPANLPHLHLMLADIATSDAEIAKFLCLSTGTVRKYRRDGQAPMPVMLALFWETSWGQNWRQTALQNDAKHAYMQAHLLKHRNTRLVKQLLTMEAAQNAQKKGAANGPLYQIG